jgi:MHS family proline/betaine transporter-like MFS transporter
MAGHSTKDCAADGCSKVVLFAMYLRQLWPLLLGNVLQWYEFGIYGFLAAQILPNFFPGSKVGLWLGYSVTFLGRPLGGLLFGWAADRFGRRTSTLLSLTGMLLATVGQGLLPSTYCCGESWGTFGVVLLVVLRSLQGFCTGGEEAAILPYVVETVPQEIKCLGASLFMVTVSVSFLLASAVVFLLESTLTKGQMLLWGWRLPFLISILPGFVSLWGRHGLAETSEFLEWQKQRHEAQSATGVETFPAGSRSVMASQIRSTLRMCRTHGCALTVLFFGTALGAVAFYQSLWCINYTRSLGLSDQAALGAGVLVQLVISVTVPTVAFFMDRMGIGPYPATLIGTACFTVSVVPLFMVINASAGNTWVLFSCLVLGYGLLLGVFFATFHILFVDLFPTEVRATAFGVTFNSSFAYFGGFAGVISQALVGVTPLGPAYYACGVGLLSTAVLIWLRRLLVKGVIQLQHFPLAEPVGAKFDHSHASI